MGKSGQSESGYRAGGLSQAVGGGPVFSKTPRKRVLANAIVM